MSRMEEHLTCNICWHLLREPKDLDCPHVFCLQCLQQWVNKEQVVECPECRCVTRIPQGGLVNLKTNLRLRNMVADYSKSDERQGGVRYCPNHDGERQHFFCVTCGVPVCHQCLVLKHERPMHEIKDLKTVSEAKREELKGKLNNLEEEMKKEESVRKQLDHAKRTLEAGKDKAVKDIKKQTENIVAMLEAKEKDLIACVERSCQTHKKQIDEKRKRVEESVTNCESVHAATRSAVDNMSDQVYIENHASLVEQTSKLCEGLSSDKEVIPSDLGSLCFNPGTDPNNLAWFGDAMIYGKKIPVYIPVYQRKRFRWKGRSCLDLGRDLGLTPLLSDSAPVQPKCQNPLFQFGFQQALDQVNAVNSIYTGLVTAPQVSIQRPTSFPTPLGSPLPPPIIPGTPHQWIPPYSQC